MGDRLATIDMGRKVGEAAVPLSVGGAKSPSNTISLGSRLCLHTKWHLELSNRLATMHQRYRQTDRQDRQDNGPVAQGEPLSVTVAQKPDISLLRLAPHFVY